MKLLLWGEYTHTTPRVQLQLVRMGYETVCFGEKPRVGVLNEQKRRTQLMRMIADVDAVFVPGGPHDPAALARLAVVCEFAGRPLLVGDLPNCAPDTVAELLPFAEKRAVRCTWMAVYEPMEEARTATAPEPGQKWKMVAALQRMKSKVMRFEEKVNALLGDGLKNPRAREQRSPVLYPESTALTKTG